MEIVQQTTCSDLIAYYKPGKVQNAQLKALSGIVGASRRLRHPYYFTPMMHHKSAVSVLRCFSRNLNRGTMIHILSLDNPGLSDIGRLLYLGKA